MDPVRARRRIRQAGYAALVFAVYQLIALPAPLHHATGSAAWVVEWMTVATVGVTLLLAIMAVRESAVAGALLGVYGVYRFVLLGIAVVRVLDGTAVQVRWGPAWVLVIALSIPFAAFWVRGGLAALAVMREQPSTP